MLQEMDYLPSLQEFEPLKSDLATGYLQTKSSVKAGLDFLESLMPNLFRLMYQTIDSMKLRSENVHFSKLRLSYSISFRNILENSAALSIGKKAHFVGVLQPQLDTKNARALSKFENEISQFYKLPHDQGKYDKIKTVYKTLSKMFSSDEATFLDLTQAFDKVSETTYFDLVHYSARGNEILAESIARAILKKQRPIIALKNSKHIAARNEEH